MNYAIAPKQRTLADVLPVPSSRANALLRDVALVVGFAVFTALLAQIRINLSFTPVPITGQTLGVLLAGTRDGLDGPATGRSKSLNVNGLQ